MQRPSTRPKKTKRSAQSVATAHGEWTLAEMGDHTTRWVGNKPCSAVGGMLADGVVSAFNLVVPPLRLIAYRYALLACYDAWHDRHAASLHCRSRKAKCDLVSLFLLLVFVIRSPSFFRAISTRRPLRRAVAAGASRASVSLPPAAEGGTTRRSGAMPRRQRAAARRSALQAHRCPRPTAHRHQHTRPTWTCSTRPQRQRYTCSTTRA